MLIGSQHGNYLVPLTVSVSFLCRKLFAQYTHTHRNTKTDRDMHKHIHLQYLNYIKNLMMMLNLNVDFTDKRGWEFYVSSQ